MAKTKTSKKQETTSEKFSKINLDKVPGLKKYDPLTNLTNEKKVGEALVECLKNNDPEGVMEVIQTYIWASNKKKHKGVLPKSTFYHSIKNKNPTIKTLAKIISSFSD